MKISIVLPIRNGIDHLDSCISNLKNSCGEFDEIIIINNGSTDGTTEYLTNLTYQDSRFRVFNEGVVGLVNALNFGVSKSSNEWIFRVDVDDLYRRDRFEIQKLAIVNQPDSIAIFSDYRIIGQDNEDLGYIPTALHPSAVPISLLSTVRSPHPVVAFRKSAFMEVGGYRERDFPAEDLSLWLRMSNLGMLISLPVDLLKYRINAKSITSQNRVQSKLMSFNVLRESRLPQSAIANFQRDLGAILVAYSIQSYQPERIILLALDVVNLHRMNYTTASQSIKILFNIIRSLKMSFIPNFLQIYIESHRRRKYRGSQSIS